MEIINDDQRVQDLAGVESHVDYVTSLHEEHRIMLSLRDNVYEGSWAGLLSSLYGGLSNDSYRKICGRIKSDIVRIGEMWEYETAHGVNLSDYV